MRHLTLPVCLLIAMMAAGAAEAKTCSSAGPQAPRDIDQTAGSNPVTFSPAPPAGEMQLCDIHFHKFAEHKAHGYPTPAGDGGGYLCKGTEPGTAGKADHDSACGGVVSGDTIEVHWVFTTCEVRPAPGLGSCFIEDVCENPQLRVEAQVFYLTDDSDALDFAGLAEGGRLPSPQGAVEYLGSTTGPSFNDRTCSPFQVTWNVRPTCDPLRLSSLGAWCGDNPFNEDHAHGVRELVTAPLLLSRID